MGNIISDADTCQLWRYQPVTIEFFVNGVGTIDIPKERFKTIAMIDNFEENQFPVFRCTLVIESSKYYAILQNKNSAKLHLRIDKYFMKIDNSDKSLNRRFIDDTFDLIMDDADSDKYQGLKQSQNSTDFTSVNQNDSNNLKYTDSTVEFFLFKADYVNGMKTKVNAILEKATVADAIAYIFSKANVKNILMSPPDNTKKKKTLIIPPLDCMNALKFIDSYYGIYKRGSLIYFGLDRGYVLSYKGDCTAFEPDENKVVTIIVPQSKSGHYDGSCGLKKAEDPNNDYILAEYSSLSVRNDSISNNVIGTNTVKVVDSYTGESETSDSNAVTKGDSTEGTIENKTENEFLTDMYQAQIDSTSLVIDLRLENFDVSCMKPNRKFNIIFEDSNMTKKYQGIYQLTCLNTTFIDDSADLGVSVIARFKKTNYER